MPRSGRALSSALVIVFLLGVAVRLGAALATGYGEDIPLFQGWAARLVSRGPWGFYPEGAERVLVDYPPVYLYVLWIVGLVTDLFGAVPTAFILKLPAIGADVVLAIVAMAIARRAGADRRWQAFAAAGVMLNPAFVFVSSVMARPDALAFAFAGIAVILLTTGHARFGRVAAAIALCGVAVLTRPQSVFVMPFAALVFLWRYVFADDAGRARRFVQGAIAGAVAGAAIVLPFATSPLGVYRFFRETGDTFPARRVFDFNLWGIFGIGRPESGAGRIEILGVPALVIGAVVFVVVVLYVRIVLWRSLREGPSLIRHTLLAAAATLATGFAVLTGFHARFLLATVAVMVPFVATRWVRFAVAGLSVLAVIHVVYAYTYEGGPTVYGTPAIGWDVRTLCVVSTVAAVAVAVRSTMEIRAGRVSSADRSERSDTVSSVVSPPEPRMS